VASFKLSERRAPYLYVRRCGMKAVCFGWLLSALMFGRFLVCFGFFVAGVWFSLAGCPVGLGCVSAWLIGRCASKRSG